MSDAHLQAREAELAAEVQEYLDQWETHDTADDATHGSEQWSVPAGLADVQQRLAMIQAAKARWEAQAQARVAAAHSETVAQADATGKPAPPPPEEPATPDPRTQTRVTDPDSRIMRHSDPAFIQGATRRWRWMPTSRSFSRRP